MTLVDGTAQSITVTINGAYEPPDAFITGDTAASLTEEESVDANGDLVASGQLEITDDDAVQAFFNAATIPGAHGSLTIDASGAWTYEVTTSCPRCKVWA